MTSGNIGMTVKKPLTKLGHKRILGEFEQLTRVERPGVVKGVSDAAAEGDRSENAEYIYGKKKLREIDKRLQYLSNLLKDVRIVDPNLIATDIVVFGSTVEAEDDDRQAHSWMIVGNGEADFKEGTVSYHSPVGKALMGKKVGDLVEIHRPKGVLEVEIVGIENGERRS